MRYDKKTVLCSLDSCTRQGCKDEGCPYWSFGHCEGNLIADALELIEEQRERIEKLEQDLQSEELPE